MGRLTEPDDIDFIVSGGDPDPRSLQETIDFIQESRRRAEYQEEAREAKRILDAIGIRPGDHGMKDPAALLDHWRKCVADLTRDESEKSNGQAE